MGQAEIRCRLDCVEICDPGVIINKNTAAISHDLATRDVLILRGEIIWKTGLNGLYRL